MNLGVEQKPAASSNGAGSRSSSLDRIRAKNKAARKPWRLDLPVPGYDGELGVRYHAIDEDDVARLEAAAGNVKAQVDANLDGLIAACECIVVRSDTKRDENGEPEWEPLTADGEPVYFNDKLVEILDLDVSEDPSAREIVLAIFSTLPAPYMGASQHAMEIVKWMGGVEGDALQGLLGKS